MYLRHLGMHIAMDSWLLILSFELKFVLCVVLFSYEDSENWNPVSVRTPRKEITLVLSISVLQ